MEKSTHLSFKGILLFLSLFLFSSAVHAMEIDDEVTVVEEDQATTSAINKPGFMCDHPDCYYSFTFKNNLTRHQLTHADNRPFMGDHPNWNYLSAQQSTLASHPLTHPKDKNYLAPNYPFYAFNTLYTTNIWAPIAEEEIQKIHQLAKALSPLAKGTYCIAVEKQPFEGDASKSSQDQSTTSTVNKAKFIFHECKKSFTYLSTLTTHERTHTKEKPFTCDYPSCTWAFAQKSDLNKHQRIHTGERPFICDHPGCSYASMNKSNLTRHKRTHTVDKPFTCDHPNCSYTSTRKDRLTAHQQTHTRKKNDLTHYYPFYTLDTLYDYSNGGTLKEHQNKHSLEAVIVATKKAKLNLSNADSSEERDEG